MNPENNGGQVPQPPTQPPQQQYGQPSPGNNPYDFIMNPQKPSRSPFSIGASSLTMRIAIAIGGLAALIIIVVVVAQLITSGSSQSKADFVAVAQDQTEIVRIATAASNNATSLKAQNLAHNVQASITSANTELLTYMSKNGMKTNTKVLGLKRSSSVDTTLQNAKEAGTYDAAFTDLMQTDLANYAQALQKTYKTDPGPKGKALLIKQYNAAELLLTQSKQQ